jgi:two-component system, NarL family, invasion response regulator UvrY
MGASPVRCRGGADGRAPDRRHHRCPHERLSPRELEVFQRLARGEGPSEIAATLGLSLNSVSTYRSRVLEKLGLQRNADLTRYALEHDLRD